MSQMADALDIGELSMFATETIRQLGREALKYYGQGCQHPPFDQGLVTRAELHLNDTFQQLVTTRYRGHTLYGLEPLSQGYSHDASRYLWVFDPLDGVDNFQTGIPVWGMSLALYENNWPVIGIFSMPVTDDLFRAVAGEPAFWNDRPISIDDRGELTQESHLLTFSRFHQHYQIRFPGKVRALGSTGVHACYVAMGRADAAIVAKESFKDLAAVRVIVESAGGRLYNLDGTDFMLGDYAEGQCIVDPLLIAGPNNALAVRECMVRF